MSIRQFNGTYMANDDRLLFRFNTADDSEYRFWFTRRVTLFVLAATEHLVEKKLAQNHPEPTAKAIAEFQQEAVKEKANFTAEYQVATKFPLGADPVLVMDVKCAMMEVERQSALAMDLILPGGANVNLKLTIPILHTMRLLLERLAAQANWGAMQITDGKASTSNPTPATEAATEAQAVSKKNLH